MPPKKVVTAETLLTYIKSNLWQNDPDELYAKIRAVKRRRKTLKRLSNMAKYNAVIKEATDLIPVLKEAGFNSPNTLSSSSNSSVEALKPLRTVKAKSRLVSANSNTNENALNALNSIAGLSPPKAAPKVAVAAPKVAPKVVIAAPKVAPKAAAKAAAAAAEDAAEEALEDAAERFPSPPINPASCNKLRLAFVDAWVASITEFLAAEIAAVRALADPGAPRGTRNEDVHPAFNRDFQVKLTEGDGTCLIHAFLTDVSPTYRSLPTRFVQGVVGRAFRKRVYAQLRPHDEEMLVSAGDYATARANPSTRARTAVEGGAPVYYVNARAYIRDTDGFLYDAPDIENLQECFGVRIIITKSDGRIGHIRLKGDVGPVDLRREYDGEVAANIPADKYTPYIMIFQTPGHYEAVKRRGAEQYIFTYPEVRDVLEGAVEAEAVVDADIKARLRPGAVLSLVGDRVAVVHADGVRQLFHPFPDAPATPVGVYIEGAAGEELVSLTEILMVDGEPFNSIPYVLGLFQPRVIVTLTGGKKMKVHARGVQMAANPNTGMAEPIGVWLVEAKGAPKAPILHGLQMIERIGSHDREVGEPFTHGRFRAGAAVAAAAAAANANAAPKKGATKRLFRKFGGTVKKQTKK